MPSLSKYFGLNPYAPEYIPSRYPYYVFLLPQYYPLTFYNINNYQQTYHYHANPTPPQPPTVAPPQASLVSSHRRPVSQEIVKRQRFGGACSRNRVEEKKWQVNFKSEKTGKQNEGGGACRVVQTCVMVNRRPKPVLPLRYGEDNVDVNANITTVMIRNIPNKLTRNEMLTLLDKHCMLVNEGRGDEILSAYDFVYLPIDFKSKVNKGYAFVNFTNTKAVKKFHSVFHKKAWDDFETPKICEIVCAKIQGKDELMKHFGGTIFMCSYDEYLPVCFSPPRDGSGKPVEQLIVGKRSSQDLAQQTYKKVWEEGTQQWKGSSNSWGTQLKRSF